MPVTKTSLPSRHVPYDAKECSHHTLYSGTSIIQTKYEDFYFFLMKKKKKLCVTCAREMINHIRRFYKDRPVLARVIRTGFLTNRGSLIAAILYPPPADFKFDKDSYKFIGILAFIATCGFIYTVITKV